MRRQQDMEIADLGDVPAMPGAHELLAQIARNRQLPWALATSLHARLLEVRMAAAGLPLPSTVVTSDLVVHGKPDPESYRLAAAKLGVSPPECLVVEDSPAGLIAGRAAGLPRSR